MAVGKAGGRAETDYAAIAERSSISLTNAFIHWGEADWKGSVSRKKVELQLAKMLDAMVACHGADFFVRAIKGRWPDHMAEALSKGIKP